jgi:hypothetical protein
MQFLRCCLGSEDSLAPETQLQGQLGAAYLFDKALTPETVDAMSVLGPGYVRCSSLYSSPPPPPPPTNEVNCTCPSAVSWHQLGTYDALLPRTPLRTAGQQLSVLT